MHLITTINVNGLNKDQKAETIFHKLRTSKSDIIFLQETHLNDVSKNRIFTQQRWPGQSLHAFSGNNTAGVSVLFSDKLPLYIFTLGKQVMTADPF